MFENEIEEIEEYNKYFEKYGDEIKDKIQKSVRKDRIYSGEIKKIIMEYDKSVTKQELSDKEMLDNKIFAYIEAYLLENKITITGKELSFDNEIENLGYDSKQKIGVSYKETLQNPCDAQKNIELIKRIKSGDKAAKNEMIEGNIGLVFSYVGRRHKYLSARLGGRTEFEDLIQEGIMSLSDAIDKYDYTKGAFATYAMFWIRQRIDNAIINKERAVRIPVHIGDQIDRLNIAIRKFNYISGKDPTEGQLAESLGLSLERIRELMEINKMINVESLDESFGQNQELQDYVMHYKDGMSDYEWGAEEQKKNLHSQTTSREKEAEFAGLLDTDRAQNIQYDTVVDGVYLDKEEVAIQGYSSIDERQGKDSADKLEIKLLNEELIAMLDELSSREKKVLMKRYFGEQTLDDIAQFTKRIRDNGPAGVNGQQVNQIETKALEKMRNPVRSKRIKDFMDNADLEQYMSEEFISFLQKEENEKKEMIERTQKLEENIAELNEDELNLFIEYYSNRAANRRRIIIFSDLLTGKDNTEINEILNKFYEYFDGLDILNVLEKLESEKAKRESSKLVENQEVKNGFEDRNNENRKKIGLIQEFKGIKEKKEQEETRNVQLKEELASLNKKEEKGDEQ